VEGNQRKLYVPIITIMTQKEVQNNFELSAEFNKFIIKHPEIARRIAAGAYIVFASPVHPEVTKKAFNWQSASGSSTGRKSYIVQ
jgi:Family of unknown function (DUF5647)